MAIPSGAGTEVLKRTTIHAQSSTSTSFRWDGTMATTGTESYTVPANHIITVISLVAAEQGNAAETFNFYMHDGSNYIIMLQNQDLAAYGTFVWNDKIVITGGDKLVVIATSGNIDFLCSYIDQDWT